MGRICYEAFKNLHDRHHFPLDFPSAALARQVLGMMVSRSDFYSVVALLDGQVVGSNFLSLSDPVAGIGPVTVEPGFAHKRSEIPTRHSSGSRNPYSRPTCPPGYRLPPV
jgi:hypothetical protein